MREVVTCLDEFLGRELSLLEELGLFEDRHDAANDACHCPVDRILDARHHYCFLLTSQVIYSVPTGMGKRLILLQN